MLVGDTVVPDLLHPGFLLVQDQGISHQRDDGDGYWPITSLPQVHDPFVLQYGPFSTLVYPLPGLMHPSAMCKSSSLIFVPFFSSLSPRNILMAPRIRRHSHLHWCRSHDSHGNCLPAYRHAHGVLGGLRWSLTQILLRK